VTTDSYIRGQYLKLIGARCLIFVLVFVSRDFIFKLAVSRSRPSVPYGANFLLLVFFLLYSLQNFTARWTGVLHLSWSCNVFSRDVYWLTLQQVQLQFLTRRLCAFFFFFLCFECIRVPVLYHLRCIGSQH